MQIFIIFFLYFLVLGCAEPKFRVHFLSEACIIPHYKFQFKTCSNLYVTVDDNVVIVPKGFLTDLASIPRPLWAIYSPNDSRSIGAAILHDYLYRNSFGYTRKQCDQIFYAALLKCGARKTQALNYYCAVRAFGWTAYQQKIYL